MTNPAISSQSDVTPGKSGLPPNKSVDEKLQKLVDKGLYANGRSSAQQIRNFLNGTWLGEPLHVVLTDVPIGAWTVTIAFDALDSIGNRREFSFAADTSLAIGLLGAAGAAVTGIADWSDVDPPARRLGLMHGLLNVSVTAIFATSLILRRRKLRTGGRISAALGYALLSLSAHLGGKLVYERRVGVDRTAGEVFPKDFVAVLAESKLADSVPTRAIYDGAPILLVRADGEFSRWLRRARISAGRSLKANCSATVLFVHITPRDLHLRMAVCLTGQPCIHSRAWRSGCKTVRSKCGSHRRKPDNLGLD